MKQKVNQRENRSGGLVELKGEGVAFLFFLLKRIVLFFCKGAHGLGFGHGLLFLIDGSWSTFFLFICT